MAGIPRIALVTYDPGGEVSKDEDLPVLADALHQAGARTAVVFWDDPDVDWAAFDLALIRSTWDYSWRAEEFTAWAERCGKATRLANPAGVVRWNADKRYLGQLAEAGVPTVPTRYFAPGDPVELPADREFVVKPASGAGARYAARHPAGERDAALRQAERMHAEGFTVMVQPYLSSIDTHGERALQFFGGRLLHASVKGAVLAPGTPYDAEKVAHPDLRRWEPAPAELAVAERALAAVPVAAELLYARVDLVTGPDGEPCVMELELIEPNLFLDLHPDSVPRVVRAVLTAAG
ncbi:ATP-grasp domain-containing protein [Streptomyces tuirus]|uniref:ATP-grasp domain-containing protein n=1 Tax=Streptomyces tuirus TaxID=68278 RepID=A0A7G1NEP7_9ACTN|nr:ATP-grasp domain-containing protein [Streptomyces tuirus]